jgi:hypothetical protein
MAVVTQIQVRRGTAAQWTSANPTLASGEWGFETDTGKVKIGNGSTVWTGLSYTGSATGTVTSITAGTGLSGGTITSTGTIAIDNTVATLTGSQTLTNKTLTTPVISSISNTGTLTLPTSTDTLVGRATTDTLTNKTLTTPVITQGQSTPSFTTNAYTLVAGDAGLLLLASNSTTAGTINIPTNASVAFAVGTQITILQTGTGQLTIQATTSGTTTVLSTGATAASPKCRAQYSAITIIKTATDTWYAMGDIS